MQCTWCIMVPGSKWALFESLGFNLPDRKAVAEFLQEICSEKDQEVRPSSLDFPDRQTWVTSAMLFRLCHHIVFD